MKHFLALVALGLSSLSLGATHEISQKEKKFSQSELTIKVGDKVLFKNDDDTKHHLYSKDVVKINKIQDPNSSHEQIFDKEGELTIRCAIHPKMKLNIKVMR